MKIIVIASAFFVALSLLSLHVSAQSDCQQVVVGLAPCLQYIVGNVTTPSSGCCTQLASIVKTQPRCLCEVLIGEGSSLGVNVNQTLALALPKACDVQIPLSKKFQLLPLLVHQSLRSLLQEMAQNLRAEIHQKDAQ